MIDKIEKLNFNSLLTEKEVAELLNVHLNTLKKWRWEGKINHYKFGKIIRYSKKHIIEFLKKQEQRNI